MLFQFFFKRNKYIGSTDDLHSGMLWLASAKTYPDPRSAMGRIVEVANVDSPDSNTDHSNDLKHRTYTLIKKISHEIAC